MEHRQIPGTPVFDGEAAPKGYALNNTGDVSRVHGNYHIPISNTASALLENRALELETTYRKAS
jgi:hypothetical protein